MPTTAVGSDRNVIDVPMQVYPDAVFILDDNPLYFGNDGDAFLMWDATAGNLVLGGASITLEFGDDDTLSFGDNNEVGLSYDTAYSDLTFESSDVAQFGLRIITDFEVHWGTGSDITMLFNDTLSDLLIEGNTAGDGLRLTTDTPLKFGTAATSDVRMFWDDTTSDVHVTGVGTNRGLRFLNATSLKFGTLGTSDTVMFWDDTTSDVHVTGTGTSAGLRFLNATQLKFGTLGTSDTTLFWDDTTSDVHVTGTGTSAGLRFLNGTLLKFGTVGTSDTQLFWDDTTSDVQVTGTGTSAGIRFQNGLLLKFGTAGTSDTQLFWDDTTSDVQMTGTGTSAGLRLQNAIQLKFGTSGASDTTLLWDDTTSDVHIGGTGADSGLRFLPQATLKFGPAIDSDISFNYNAGTDFLEVTQTAGTNGIRLDDTMELRFGAAGANVCLIYQSDTSDLEVTVSDAGQGIRFMTGVFLKLGDAGTSDLTLTYVDATSDVQVDGNGASPGLRFMDGTRLKFGDDSDLSIGYNPAGVSDVVFTAAGIVDLTGINTLQMDRHETMHTDGQWGGGVVGRYARTEQISDYCIVYDEGTTAYQYIPDSATFAGWANAYQICADQGAQDNSDAVYFGAAAPFAAIYLDILSDARYDNGGTSDAWTWQFSQGGAVWSDLAILFDGTAQISDSTGGGVVSFNQDGTICFAIPATWDSDTISDATVDATAYWIRAVVTTEASFSDYGTLNAVRHYLEVSSDSFRLPYTGTITDVRLIDQKASMADANIHASDATFLIVNETAGTSSDELTIALAETTQRYAAVNLAFTADDAISIVSTSNEDTGSDIYFGVLELETQ